MLASSTRVLPKPSFPMPSLFLCQTLGRNLSMSLTIPASSFSSLPSPPSVSPCRHPAYPCLRNSTSTSISRQTTPTTSTSFPPPLPKSLYHPFFSPLMRRTSDENSRTVCAFASAVSLSGLSFAARPSTSRRIAGRSSASTIASF